MTTKQRRLIFAALLVLAMAGGGAWYLGMAGPAVADARHIRAGMTRDEAAAVLGTRFEPPRNEAERLAPRYFDVFYVRDGVVTVYYDKQNRVTEVRVQAWSLGERLRRPFRVQP